ncbi:MAG: hypothetical protein KAJ19_15495, partial [Gammaproteobacteria bacterium]|nr:hypothetical protein [Gammaproteobacteria bacterium]
MANETSALDNNNKISLTTDRVEELWSELSQAWPAVKNNPEIAEKIEKLWDILKTSGNDHLAISSEIQNLLDNSNTSTALISSNPFTTTKQTDEDLDSLLAEILGENYQNETIHSVTQPEQNQSISASASTTSGTEELDKLVASILGEDWLKDESSTTNSISSDDKQAAKTIPNVKTSESSDLIFKTNHNIDSLVSSIIGDDLNEESSIPTTAEVRTENQKLIEDKEDINKLLNDILNEDDVDESLTTNNNSPSDNIYELNIKKPTNENPNKNVINDTDSASTISNLSSITNEEQNQTAESKTEEN